MGFLDKYASQIQGITRIVVGLLFLEHGTGKMFSFPLAAGASPHVFHLMSFPVGPAGVIEVVAGILITIGFFSRWAAFIASGSAVKRAGAHAGRFRCPEPRGGAAQAGAEEQRKDMLTGFNVSHNEE